MREKAAIWAKSSIYKRWLLLLALIVLIALAAKNCLADAKPESRVPNPNIDPL
jgi:hypothetical protein